MLMKEYYALMLHPINLSKNVLAFLIVLTSGLLKTSRTLFCSNITAELCKKSQKNSKNNILLGSHLNNLFLLNKNYYSMVSDGIGNFINVKINDLSKFPF